MGAIQDQIAESDILHQGTEKSRAVEHAIEVMESVQIADASRVGKSYPHQLSGGMRQRVLLAIAISSNPSLLIVDEPTTALDVITQAQIINLLKKLRQDMKMGMIVITHDMGVAAQICDRLAVMYAGRIVEQSDTETIIRNAMHPYSIGLLNSIPRLDTRRGMLKSISGSVPDLTNPPFGCVFHPRCSVAGSECERREPKMLEITPNHLVACTRFDSQEATHVISPS